ncbi:cbb3-type cytochrome oxidase assembly protein CcoS [Dyella telluris]|uniref:Cbb3-type cytochrome oxidase assembly protein CcoS n=1 Tax=Dyella telluris TaxID=2763498 RepID=A0A7G8Q335_9GAMM|nr:cbb3-type cytochrome oxidase assembly protein CcoS [Dyella telluris]QNK01193.1 cbb3-type cytochrome oxidase assembly protein CcoS [Dyella telluris]
MNIILVLIPVTLLIVIVAVGVFFWAAHHQQFDDLDSPGVLPLMEEREPAPAPSTEQQTDAASLRPPP